MRWKSGSRRRHAAIGSGEPRSALSWRIPPRPAITTAQGSPAWLWVGVDERGRELEVVAVQAQSDRDPEPVLLVIHVMPTHYRPKDPR